MSRVRPNLRGSASGGSRTTTSQQPREHKEGPALKRAPTVYDDDNIRKIQKLTATLKKQEQTINELRGKARTLEESQRDERARRQAAKDAQTAAENAQTAAALKLEQAQAEATKANEKSATLKRELQQLKEQQERLSEALRVVTRAKEYEIKELKRVNTDSAKYVVNATQKLQSANDQNKAAQADLVALKKELADVNAQIDQKENQKQAADEEVESLKSKLDEAKNQITKSKREYDEKVNRLNAKARQADQNRKDAEARLQKLTKANERKLSDAKQLVEELTKSKEDAEASLQKLTKSTQANEQKLSDANQLVEELTKSKEAAETKADNLLAEKEKAQQDIAKANSAVKKANAKIISSKEEITKLTNNLDRSKRDVARLEERLQSTADAQTADSATIDDLTKKLNESKSNVTRLEEEQQRLKNATDAQAIASTNEIDKLTKKLDESKSAVTRLEEERTRLLGLQSTADTQTAELQEQLTTARTDVTNLNTQLETLKSTIQENQANADKATTTIRELTAKNSAIEAELQTARESAETAKAEAAATRNEIESLNSELELNRARTAEVERELTAADAKVFAAGNELAKVKDANQELSAQNERLVAQYEEAQTNVTRARQDARTASATAKDLEDRLKTQENTFFSERDKLEAQLKSANTRATEAEDELAKTKTSINKFESNARRAQLHAEKMLRQSESNRDEERNRFDEEVAQLNQKLKNEKDAAQKTINELTASLNSAVKTVRIREQIEAEKDEQNALRSQLTLNQIRETESELNAVKASNIDLQDALDTQENEISSLRAEVGQSSASIARLETIIDEQDKAANEQQRVTNELEAQNTQLLSENENLEAQLASVTAELESSESAVNTAEAAKVAAETARELLEDEQQRLQDRIASIQSDLLAKTTAATTNSAEVDKLRKQLETVTAERDQLDAHAAEIEEAKRILSTSEGRLTEDKETLTARVNALEDKIENQRAYLTNAIQAAFPRQLTFSDQTFTYTNQQVVLESLLDDVSLDALNQQVQNIRDGNIRTINEAIEGLRDEKTKIEKVNATLRKALKDQGQKRKNAEARNAELSSKVNQQERALEASNETNAKLQKAIEAEKVLLEASNENNANLKKSLDAQGEQLKQTQSTNAALSSEVNQQERALKAQAARIEEAAQAKEALLQAVQVAFPQKFTFVDQTVGFDSGKQQDVLKRLLENADVSPEALTQEIESIRTGNTRAIQDVINGLIQSKNEEIQAVKTTLEANNAALAEKLQNSLEAESKSDRRYRHRISALKQSIDYHETTETRLKRRIRKLEDDQKTLPTTITSLETNLQTLQDAQKAITTSVSNAVTQVAEFVDLAGSENLQSILNKRDNAELIPAGDLASAIGEMANAFETTIRSFTDQGALDVHAIERRAKELADREAAVAKREAAQRNIDKEIAKGTEALRTENQRLRKDIEEERVERDIHGKIEELLGATGGQESETSLAQRAYSLLSTFGITTPVVSNEDVVNAVKTLVDDTTEKEALKKQNAALQKRLDTFVEYTTNPDILDAERLSAELDTALAERRANYRRYEQNLTSLREQLQDAGKLQADAVQQGVAQTEASNKTQQDLKKKVRDAEERARIAEERARKAQETVKTLSNENTYLSVDYLQVEQIKSDLTDAQKAVRDLTWHRDTLQAQVTSLENENKIIQDEKSKLEESQNTNEITLATKSREIDNLTEQLERQTQVAQALNEANTTLSEDIAALRANVQQQFDQSTAGLQFALGQASEQNTELQRQFYQEMSNASTYVSQLEATIQTLTAQLYAKPEPTIDQWAEYQRVVALLQAAQEREGRVDALEQQLKFRDKQLTSRNEALARTQNVLDTKIRRQTRLNEEALNQREQLRNEETRIQQAIAEAVGKIRLRGQGQLDDASAQAARVLEAAQQVLSDAQNKALDVESNAQRNAEVEAANIIAAAKAEASVLIDQGKQQAQEQARALRAQEDDFARIKRTLLSEISQERQNLQRESERRQAQLRRNAEETFRAQQQALNDERDQIQKQRSQALAELDALRKTVERASVASNDDKLAELARQVVAAEIRTRDASAIAQQLQVRNSDVSKQLQAATEDASQKEQDNAQLRAKLEKALAENARLQSQDSAMDTGTAEAIETPDTNAEIDKYLLRKLPTYAGVYRMFNTKPTMNMWNAMWDQSNRSYSAYASSGATGVMEPRGIGTQRLMDLALRSQNARAITEALQKINSMTSGTHRATSATGVFNHLVGLFVGDESERNAIRTLSDSNFVDTTNTIGWIEVMIALVREFNDVRIFNERLFALTQAAGTSAQDYNNLLVDVATYVRAQAFSTNPQTGTERVR